MNTMIKSILASIDVDGWHILERETTSNELFYIKENVDMNRMKKVHHFEVTVFKDFEADGKQFKGSSSTKIAPTMNESEVKSALEDAAYAATFVKNAHYPLVKGQHAPLVTLKSQLNDKALHEWLPSFTEALFEKNIPASNALNSAELFLNKNRYNISNSEGVDVSYANHDVHIEFITSWAGDKEEVESFRNMNLADYAPEQIAAEVDTMISISREKSNAQPTPTLNNFNVLLTGSPVKEFFSYYLGHASARSFYEQISTFSIGDSMQGEPKGDKINITLDPSLENSTFSQPFDGDGLALKKVQIIEDGILKRYWGNQRFSHYMNVEPTGLIRNHVITPGSKSIDEMKTEPYIELLEFSDFQMNGLTGDFAGEIRLGRYFDGKKIIPVTTGSVSGNIKDVQENMYLSKETYQENNYLGPRTLQLLNVNIAGN